VSTAEPKSKRKRGVQAGHVKRISRLQSVGRKALEAGYNDIVADVRHSAALNIDETGWRQNGSKAWLWTVVGRLAMIAAASWSLIPQN